ncbi:hypothetical protein LPTSP3_g31310 [Leptospira kobayashii]|uniref:Restriction endonuclease type IV Mrr domain-containing protein n=1 Tax=Leptospira kobayashii TaxID=1917830 RepID=A0ABN6KJT6_9LEPT|nr:hypothetical protein [Leptospira kobayashii]BDA80201.1 hypothetical protein LPTSP3_g31310 [Leptospira kobayashii]
MISIKAKEFEDIVFKILKKIYPQVDREKEGFDIIITDSSNKKTYAEVKFSSNYELGAHIIMGWADKLNTDSFFIVSKESTTVIITSCYVSDQVIISTFERYGIHIFDIRSLLDFSLIDKFLKNTLESFLFENVINFQIPIEIYNFNKKPLQPPKRKQPTLDVFNAHTLDNNYELKDSKEEHEFCKKLKLINPGRDFFRDYENLLTDIIKFLFETDIVNWKSQKRTESDLNIFDLIGRITSKSLFLSQLQNDFGSKFILFEFKNYSDPLPPNTIYTTERYLFKTGLRNIAYIISRQGPSNNAIVAARGALKESGKLILFLTDEDLCKMIELKAINEDFYSILEEKLDDFLMNLDRN